jgi:release factor glutamine methyltransferase
MSTETWTLGRLLQWTTTFLTDKHAETPRLDAEVLLAHTLNVPRIALYTRFDEIASEETRARYRQLVKQRVEGTPVAYLVGFKEFYNLRFAVSPAVLIPRPETELVVLEAIRLAKAMTKPRVVDVGTGSGIMAVTLARYVPAAEVTAIDLSPDALVLAQQNATTLGVTSRIRFLQGDLLAPVADELFDMVMSNPPYIASEVMPVLPDSVKKFEPHLALDGGPGGLQVIEKLAVQAHGRLKSGGFLVLEIGYDQGKTVPDLLNKLGYDSINVQIDHAGHPRIVRAVK